MMTREQVTETLKVLEMARDLLEELKHENPELPIGGTHIGEITEEIYVLSDLLESQST